MKKQILLATAAVLVSGNVFATKARMQALGQDNDGSWLLNDTRNTFYNAASLNGMKDYVVIESGAVNAADTETAPAAEGGFYRSHGDMAYGAYFGRTGADMSATNDYASLVTAASAAATGTMTAATGAGFHEAGDQIDLFVSGDMGVEWGARLTYASVSDERSQVTTGNAFEQTRSTLGVGLGMNMGDLSASANLGLSDKAEGIDFQGDKWEADLGLDLNVDYRMNGNTFHIGYDKSGYEFTDQTAANTTNVESEGSYTVLELGWGRVMEVSSTSRWFYSATFMTATREVTDRNGSTGDSAERKETTMPVVVGFETDATSWLTLRGSFSQNVLFNDFETTYNVNNETINSNGKSDELGNSTAVNLGATLNFGKLMVDGVIGTNGTTNTGRLNLDQVMTRVGVHYWF